MNTNRLIIFISIILSLNSCAQNKIETKITDANGNEVITNNDDVNPNNLEKTIDEFYTNINDSKKFHIINSKNSFKLNLKNLEFLKIKK